MVGSSSNAIYRWIAITLALSVIAWLDGGFLAHWLALSPARIWRGEVWRLVTWIFIETSPTSLVMTCVVIYRFGGELAPRWGTRRLHRFMLELVLLAAVTTALLGLVFRDVLEVQRLGGWVVSDVLVIAWARQFPTSTLNVYGVMRLHGMQIVAFTAGFVILVALAIGPLWFVPELVAVAAVALYPIGRLRGL
jgi:membrane associated rhomboid family serine protease